MLHERHPCGLHVIRQEPSVAEGGLRHVGSAGPLWNMACALLRIMLRPRTPFANRDTRPDIISSEACSLPDHNVVPGLVSVRH
mgnify:CR=1 FL=1